MPDALRLLAAISPVFVVIALIAALVLPQLLGRSWVLWGWRLFRSPEQFAAELGPGIGLPAQVLGATWRDHVRSLLRVRFAGSLESGRSASVSFSPRPDFPGQNQPPLQAELALDSREAPSLRISREHFRTKIAKLLGLQDDVDTGDARFDGQFLVKARDERRALAALEGEVRKLVSVAFERHGVAELAFQNGELRAYVPLSLRRRPLSRTTAKGGIGAPLRELLVLLEQIARAFERVALDVRVLGGTRRALLGLEGRPRCAYCHGPVSGEEPDLVACDRCATVCHEECWREHGSCPVLACGGDRPERAARDAAPGRPRERA